MAEPRPMAALTAGLLARKGAARPAMRSPLQALDPAAIRHAPTEDLGWNDFGAPPPEPVATPAPAPAPEVVPLPVVHQQHETIAARIGAVAEQPATPRRSAREQGRRAAFTLRLDADRHLALRLAATIAGRSAQQVVTEALDRLLAEKPEIAALAAQIDQPRHAPNSQRGNEK
jgi:hypothetical protein